MKAGFHTMQADWEKIRDGIISVFEELKVRLESAAAAKAKREKDDKAEKDRAKLDALATAEKDKLKAIAKEEAQKLVDIAKAKEAEEKKWEEKEKAEEKERKKREKKETRRLKKLQEEEERRLKALTDMEESFMKRKLEEKPMEQVKDLVGVMGTLEDNMVIKEIRELKPPNYPPEHPYPPQQQLPAPTTPFVTILPLNGNTSSGTDHHFDHLPRHAVGHLTLANGRDGGRVYFDFD